MTKKTHFDGLRTAYRDCAEIADTIGNNVDKFVEYHALSVANPREIKAASVGMKNGAALIANTIRERMANLELLISLGRDA